MKPFWNVFGGTLSAILVAALIFGLIEKHREDVKDAERQQAADMAYHRKMEDLRKEVAGDLNPKVPAWKQEYEEKSKALDRAYSAQLNAIGSNTGLIDLKEKLTMAQIDHRGDLDDSGKAKAKQAATVYYDNLRHGTGVESGTYTDIEKRQAADDVKKAEEGLQTGVQ